MFRKSRSAARVGALILGATAMFALVACSSDDSGSDNTATATATATEDAGSGDEATSTVTVTLGAPSELELEVAPASVPAGTVTFEIANEGALLHEFVLIKTDSAAADLPATGGAVDESALDVIGEVADIDPGADGNFEADLEAGAYLVLCNIPGHYLTMNTAFTVQ